MDPEHQWYGWYRLIPPGRRPGSWQLLCIEDSEQECTDRLLSDAPPGSDKLIRQGKRSPNADPWPWQR